MLQPAQIFAQPTQTTNPFDIGNGPKLAHASTVSNFYYHHSFKFSSRVWKKRQVEGKKMGRTVYWLHRDYFFFPCLGVVCVWWGGGR